MPHMHACKRAPPYNTPSIRVQEAPSRDGRGGSVQDQQANVKLTDFVAQTQYIASLSAFLAPDLVFPSYHDVTGLFQHTVSFWSLSARLLTGNYPVMINHNLQP